MVQLDDDEIAARLGVIRQQVNQRCRQMAREGILIREPGPHGRIVNRLSENPRKNLQPPSLARSGGVFGEDWFWEGNIQTRVIEQLRRDGWDIVRSSDTATRERGIDVLAERDGVILALEVKGYPSTQYQRGANIGQLKPTQPTLQAKHWFSDAFLKAARTKEQHPDWRIALALPYFDRYLSLLQSVASSLQSLSIDILLVKEDGTVLDWPPKTVLDAEGLDRHD